MHAPHACPSSPIVFWLSAWLGTTLAGAVYGGFVEGWAGAILGFYIASLFGAAILPLMAVVMWCLWLSRFRFAVALIAGATTGVVCSLGAIGYFSGLVVLAGVFGAVGAGLGGGLYLLRTGTAESGVQGEPRPRRFSMRAMLVRAATLALLVLLIGCCILAIQYGREAGRRATCENNLRLFALSIHAYDASYGELPPSVLVDANETPLLSWRVRIFEYMYYNLDFPAHMDFSKPWNDPSNAAFLDRLGTPVIQCPSYPRVSANVTHYVAVTGPGAHWTEIGQLDEEAHGNAILVVEWPPSDIHWAEPRDVSANEFLRWFESDPRRVHREGLQYIDSGGEVRNLPWNTEPEVLRGMLTPYKYAGSPRSAR